MVFSNPLASNTTIALLSGFVHALVYVGVPLAALYLVYAGFLFVSAQGDGGKLTQAKSTFMHGIAGVVVLLGAWTFITALGETLASLSAAALLIVLGVAYVYFMVKY